MIERWNNNLRCLNGQVKPPIVLRNDTEMLIAQNAHNLIWEKCRIEYDALAKKLDQIKAAGGDFSKEDAQWIELHNNAYKKIDELVIAEINAYRKERSGTNIFELEERISKLEKMIAEVRDIAEDAQSAADEAQSAADETQDKIEETLEKVEAALEKVEEALEKD